MNSDSEIVGSQAKLWRFSGVHAALIVLIAGLLIWAYWGGLERMIQRWDTSEEYGYGYFIPLITAFFIWQKRDVLAKTEFTGSYIGVLLIILGGVLLVAGELATLFIIVQYAFLLALMGVFLAIMGWRAFRHILPALLLLVFMIPLPNFLYQGLSSELQLISSQLGVAVIRAFGISVYLEGNVIDLGIYKLQVVEACSGLRYLFPLAALSYMAAYVFRGAWWKKAIIFVSSAPVTVLMNSFRIGVIGVLVDNFGIEQAEGFLHDFEGWVVFMACMGVLVLEMWLLSKIGKDRIDFADAFVIDLPEIPDGDAVYRRTPAALKASVPVVLVIAITPLYFEQRVESLPERTDFSVFPADIGEWRGRKTSLDKDVIDVLKFSDYFLADFVSEQSGELVNLYVAYYDSQRKGASIHSPSSCIPGGGWKIMQHQVESFQLGDQGELSVNRLVIQKGAARQLVYYWFDQRGRNLTNEYLVKWYLFWDALTTNRTDGALVRVTTFVPATGDMEQADARVRAFILEVHGELKKYIPR